MNYKELLNKLPSSWEQLKLKDYIKLSPVLNAADTEGELVDDDIYTIKHLSDLDMSVQIISLLTDTDIEDIEALSMLEVNQLIEKLAFIGTVPKTGKPKIAYKPFDELSYDNFITFQKLSVDFTEEGILSSAIGNLPVMLSLFAKDPNHNPEFIFNLSMPEVINGFFSVKRNTEKYLQRLERSSLLKKHLMFWKVIPLVVTQYFRNRKASKLNFHLDGTIG
ncbi:hypothetical protein [Mucilaginibacter ginsenosidivorax]|uniref:Uncharacterized protein n=1 Tax=Mucilaginibacter ginsenosidivorax TaxID=862126 RepID=A0A5B8W933_9SPHI|nr:hypothetical protein [Mucilaginibacter ginsenosidivorax]QEC78758.1 hypothetical protein FSB76_23440 [Mucilaginibacter ginsenosidivorax]